MVNVATVEAKMGVLSIPLVILEPVITCCRCSRCFVSGNSGQVPGMDQQCAGPPALSKLSPVRRHRQRFLAQTVRKDDTTLTVHAADNKHNSRKSQQADKSINKQAARGASATRAVFRPRKFAFAAFLFRQSTIVKYRSDVVIRGPTAANPG
ncbi:hypothetical protein RRG08_028912 [Elysia crispata]|uniref:Uncharacterized protein n=1 Tax=Elysia crispata TaxID=231223 RepID=A0AAE1AQ35_9GAST|nr:hypothetical protein RRG08_028912 [Elysia crispata]